MTAVAAVLALANLATPRTYWSLDSLDGSYQLLNYQAIQQHLVFGSQFIETWGPLGFIDNPQFYDRFLLSLSLLFQVVTMLALVLMVLRVLKRWLKARAVWSIVLLALLFAAGGSALESAGWRALIIGVLLALDDYAITGERVLIGSVAGATLIGLLVGMAAATEASYALLGLVILLIFTAANLVARRFRVALVTAVAAALTFVTAFLLFGGGPRALLSWPHWELQNISGYSAAMGLASSPLGRVPVIVGVGCICTCIAMVVVSVSRSLFLLWPGMVLLAIEAQAWKEGFVRSDLVHVPFFFSASIWVLFVLALLMGSTVRNSSLVAEANVDDPHRLGLGRTHLTTLFVVVLYSLALTSPAVDGIRTIVSGFDTAAHFVVSAGYANHVSAEERHDVFPGGSPRKIARLIRGRSTFAWPWNSDAIDALRGSVSILPSPQQLTTYTPGLDELDAEYLSSTHRPLYGLLDVSAIDGRLPLQTAGLTFRAIVSCYRPLFISDGILLVKSNDRRACTPQSQGGAQWATAALNGPWIDLPPHATSSVYIAAQVTPTLRGRLNALMVHESVLYVEMQLRGGGVVFDRVIPTTLADGILASADIGSVEALRSLWFGAGDESSQVVRVRFLAADSRDWAQAVRYRFFKVSPGQRVGQMAR